MRSQGKQVCTIVVTATVFFTVLVMISMLNVSISSISQHALNLVSSSKAKQVEEACSADWIFETRSLAQDDPRVVNYIRKYHLTPPSSRPYDLDKPNQDPSEYPEQLAKILQLDLPSLKKGFFIEAGALDGEYLSNTLELEKKYGWTGLLIEPNPFNLVKLRPKNRKAWISDVCLSFTESPVKIPFNRRLKISDGARYTEGMGMLEHSENNPLPHSPRDDPLLQPKDFVFAGYAECFPLFSILSALNVTVVDYFSMDIQGPELEVLKAFPFHLIKIKALSVEHSLVPNGEQAISDFLKSKGYSVFKDKDDLFAVHKDHDNPS